MPVPEATPEEMEAIKAEFERMGAPFVSAEEATTKAFTPIAKDIAMFLASCCSAGPEGIIGITLLRLKIKEAAMGFLQVIEANEDAKKFIKRNDN